MKVFKRICFCLISLVLLFSFSLQCFCTSVHYIHLYLPLNIVDSDEHTRNFFDRSTQSPKLGSAYLDSYYTVSSDVQEEKVNNISFSTGAVSDEYGSIFDQLYTVSAYTYYWAKLDTGETITVTRVKRSTTGYSVTSDLSLTAGEDFDEKYNVKDFNSQHMFDQRLAKIQIEFAYEEIYRDKVIFDPMQHGGHVVYPIIRN